jgi:hypothetical protein
VRYEDLVTEPEGTLQKVCAFVGIDYDAEMLNGMGFQQPAYASQGHALVGSRPDASRIGAWQSELSARQIEIVESIAGALLRNLGYELLNGGYARRMTDRERLTFIAVNLYRQLTNRMHRQKRVAKAVAATGNRQTLVAATQGDSA